MYKAVFYIICIFIVFENTSLSRYGGVFTAPLAITLLPLVVLLWIIKIKRITALEKRLLLFFFLSFLMSLFFIFVYYNHEAFGFLVDRGWRFFILASASLVFLLYFLLFDYNTLWNGVLLSSVVIVFVLFLNLVAPDFFNSTSFIQGTQALSPHRMRGATLEASTFGFQVGVAGIVLSRYFAVPKLLMFSLLSFLILLTTSKGGLITFSLAFFISLLSSNVINRRCKALLVSLSIFVIPFIFITFVLPALQSDIDKYSSVATRMTMIFMSIYTLFTAPLGVGYFGYLPSIYMNGESVVGFIDSLYPGVFNFSEVKSYFIFGAVKGVSTKSFVFDWMMYFGVPFCFLFCRVLLWYVRRLKKGDFHFLCLFWFVVLSITFYLPIDQRFIVPLVFAMLYKFSVKS
ncbi:hypothetical protein [Oceanimonas marisflavi]|uniref:hypothetical protein n=1 Tax=Oceanimonas marisflavi TaxID=2059724 RepID=UPI000D2F62D7|nr:hypothetical protein [Oceanimonas marisflavi]